MIFIGIDPGQCTGLAIWDSRAKSFLEISSGTFWEIIDKLSALHIRCPEATVILENPNLNKTTHGREKFKSIGSLDRKARNVGMNMRDAQLLEDYILMKGFALKTVRPTAANKKRNAEEFKKITHYPGKTNQHQRDASLLVFGR